MGWFCCLFLRLIQWRPTLNCCSCCCCCCCCCWLTGKLMNATLLWRFSLWLRPFVIYSIIIVIFFPFFINVVAACHLSTSFRRLISLCLNVCRYTAHRRRDLGQRQRERETHFGESLPSAPLLGFSSRQWMIQMNDLMNGQPSLYRLLLTVRWAAFKKTIIKRAEEQTKTKSCQTRRRRRRRRRIRAVQLAASFLFTLASMLEACRRIFKRRGLKVKRKLTSNSNLLHVFNCSLSLSRCFSFSLLISI